MQLVLEQVSKRVGQETWIAPLTLALAEHCVTVLLGATRAGKTSLMRLMAGLDAPSGGRVLVDGKDVTGLPVRERNVAMVYQQFINYPSLTVAQNIAAPLRLRGAARSEIDARVSELAERLHIEALLQRLPAELSGGQQQRVALARALAKQAPLMLLDEPLVNLDYKLREELREELTQLFAAGESTVVYATTEPGEALLLGGYTAVLHEGRLLQYGPTAQVFHRPDSVQVARAFSDPPMNLITGERLPDGVRLPGGLSLTLKLAQARDGIGQTRKTVTLGVRASALHLSAQAQALPLPGRVELAEISGSDTYIYASSAVGELVAQLPGVHHFTLGQSITLYLSAADVYVFDDSGALMHAPARTGQEG
ncbi:ABC transporter ATP-binding protein [Comamonas sp. NLF-1-9]|uniref:ABC transporter ATP-binding protein n=1 Tax=Comamonas sp. NLF-1-9 TaxID=2853163 RepID=UPI001C47C09A|nr:ABC transporter ATP-binding protein [Comamonas sp. NLF-1-9]QXL83666.1 ABC transporter ATP-binding protein [Comamonas sp. NLF-1-9]